LANLTPASLAAMGGSVAKFSASLIPSQAAALAAVQAGGMLIPPSQVVTTASGLAYSRVTKTFNGTLTVKNVSEKPINGPLQVLFTDMSTDSTLLDATGTLAGTPYLTLQVASLAPGQSLTIAIRFQNASMSSINFTPAVYSGSFK
jgi:hypothetical protein